MRQPVTVLPSASSLKSLRAAARKSMAANPFAGFANPLLTGAKGTGSQHLGAAILCLTG